MDVQTYQSTECNPLLTTLQYGRYLTIIMFTSYILNIFYNDDVSPNGTKL